MTDVDGDTAAGEVLVRAVPEEDADLIDDGNACGGDCSTAGGGAPSLLALLGLGLALLRRRERA